MVHITTTDKKMKEASNRGKNSVDTPCFHGESGSHFKEKSRFKRVPVSFRFPKIIIQSQKMGLGRHRFITETFTILNIRLYFRGKKAFNTFKRAERIPLRMVLAGKNPLFLFDSFVKPGRHKLCGGDALFASKASYH